MNADDFPTFRRFFRFILRCLRRLRRIFLSRRSAVVYLVLGTLLYLALTIDRWHGRRAWAAEKERLAAAGESLDLRDLLPKRPPDEENFCAIPELKGLGGPSERLAGRDDPYRMWLARRYVERPTVRGKLGKFRLPMPKGGLEAPLEDWCSYFRETAMLPAEPLAPNAATELVLSAGKWKHLLDAWYAASDRPTAVFLPAPAERLDANGQLNPHIAGSDLWFQVTELAHALVLHGRACLETGDTPTARMNVRVLRRFAEAFGNEPGFIGLVLSGHLNRLSSDLITAGIRRHAWNANDLNQMTNDKVTVSLSDTWRRMVLVERARDSFQTENPGLTPIYGSGGKGYYYYELRWKWPWLRRLVERVAPAGPILRHRAARSRYFSLHTGGLEPLKAGETWLARNEQLHSIPVPKPPPCVRFQDSLQHGWTPIFIGMLFRQRILEIACALERHYLTQRRYPATLDEIADPFPPEQRTDVDGRSLHYRAAADGSTFRVWSVGMNGKDDTSDPYSPADKNDDWSVSTE